MEETCKYYALGGQRVALRVGYSSGSVVYFLHSDHLGSTSLATTATGAEVTGSRTWYKPYGEVRGGGSGSPTDFGFNGQRGEPSLGGLLDYHARYYDPLLGRFLSADTIVPNPSAPVDLNRYAYARNNPVRYSDPTGHAADASGGAGLTIEDFLAIYERLYDEAPDALDPKGYAGWLKEYYNCKAALYQRLSEGRTPEEIEVSSAYVAQAYGNLLRNGYYGVRVGLESSYLASGGESAVSIPLAAGFTELTRGVLTQQLRGAQSRSGTGSSSRGGGGGGGASGGGISGSGQFRHGNRLDSPRPTWLYRLVDRHTGQVMKYGITSETNAQWRYTTQYYQQNNVRLEPIAQGQRWHMHQLEYQLNVQNNSPWSKYGY